VSQSSVPPLPSFVFAEGDSGIVAGAEGLESADDLLGGFRDQVALDLEFEAMLEERGSFFTRDPQDCCIVGRATVGI